MGGTKKKVGKQRRDKAYWSAKEIGYRSRASFKLVQLNRKFEFLQKSRVCIDLCAAPGSWMQVAKEHMPVSSLIIGIDLAPIKPIPGCICLQNDITTEKCRSDLKKELQTWKADLVLHDGAPNVGKSWIHDAYQQNLLTLHAFKLACEFLMKGGNFVTKIFRSKDYQKLIWVFNQFFKKVDATKPAASRSESAEIFVVCRGYKAPDKIDPNFFKPAHVFAEIDDKEANDHLDDADMDRELINPEKKKKKAPAEGYETGRTLLYKKAKASEFIMEDKPIHVLNNFSEIVLDEPRIYKHPKTTKEIVECCKDLKVLGMKELRLLKKWRETLKKDFEEQAQEAKEKKMKQGEGEEEGEAEDAEEEQDEAELKDLDSQIEKLKDEERKLEKRKRKKSLKEKRKLAEKVNLKMIIPGDEGPRREEEGLFQISDLKSKEDVDAIAEGEGEDDAEETDEDDEDNKVSKQKVEKYERENKKLDKSGLYYKDLSSDEEAESDEDDDDDENLGKLGLINEEKKKMRKRNRKPESLIDDDDENAESNPLLVSLDHSTQEEKRKHKAQLWFDRPAFKSLMTEDENLAEEDIEDAISEIKKKGGRVPGRESAKVDNEDSSDEPDEDDENSDFDVEECYRNKKSKQNENEKPGFEIAPISDTKKKRKKIQLTPEELALGQEMIMSKKRKRDILDSGWNRYMFNDPEEDLPDWFVKEEEIHMRKRLDLDPKVVEQYKQQQKDLNVKTIKKVVEAKARKKKKMMRKLEKAKKKAATLLDNPDLGNREKASEIKKLYKKAKSSQKEEVTYVVARKFSAGKRASRPSGVKGRYKQVDPRMKKDNKEKRSNANAKRNRKRTLKGKKARPAGRPRTHY